MKKLSDQYDFYNFMFEHQPKSDFYNAQVKEESFL